MKALVYHDRANRLHEDKPKQTVKKSTDAVVKITRTTICGTDLHVMKGNVLPVTDDRERILTMISDLKLKKYNHINL
jgi:alcohol dehydrogenase